MFPLGEYYVGEKKVFSPPVVWQLYFHCNNRARRHQTVIPFCRGFFSPSDTSVWEFPIIWSVIFATVSESPSPSFLHGGGCLDIHLHFSAVFQPDVGKHISLSLLKNIPQSPLPSTHTVPCFEECEANLLYVMGSINMPFFETAFHPSIKTFFCHMHFYYFNLRHFKGNRNAEWVSAISVCI